MIAFFTRLTMNLERKNIYLAATVAIAFCFAVFLFLLSGAKTAMIGTMTILIFAIAYRYPRHGLWLFLIYMPFAGTISYAFGSVYRAVGGYVSFTPNYAIFQLAKDIVYIPALVALIASSQGLAKLRKTAQPVVIAALLLLGTCLLTLFFVNLPQQLSGATSGKPVLMGIMGLKILIGYVPLLICGYYLIRDRNDLKFLLRLQVIIILVCCSLCLIQYLLLANGICAGSSDLPAPATTRVSLQARCFVGGSLVYNPAKKLISLPGTFVAPWQWAWFLISGSFFAFAAFESESISKSTLIWRIIHLITIALILIAAIISGQTTATILVPIIFLILLLVTESNKSKLALKLGIALILIVLIANNFGVFGSALESAIARWNYTTPQSFIAEQFLWITKHGVEILGQGLGRAASAARRLGKITLIETFYPRLLYEIGWLGTLLFLTTVSLVTVWGFKAYSVLQKPDLSKLAICLWIFIILISFNTYYYPLLVDPVAIYYWFFAGVLLKLPELEKPN